MSSDQVLDVLTKRIESALDAVHEIVNLEFDHDRSVWRGDHRAQRFRREPGTPAHQNSGLRSIKSGCLCARSRRLRAKTQQAFAQRLLGDMTPDVLIYLAESDPNFLFQLSPEVWQALPDDTVKALLAYLAGQVQECAGQESALRRLVEQEIVPSLESIPQVANVSVSGGQRSPAKAEPPQTPQPSRATRRACCSN